MATKIFHFSNTGISSGQRFYLKDDVSGIYLRKINIDSDSNIIGSNLVYNTGNQSISGIKTFNSTPNVNNTNLALSTDVMNFLPKVRNSNTFGVYNQGSAGSSTGPSSRNRRFSLIYFPSSGNITGFVLNTILAPNNVNSHIALWNIGSNGLPGNIITGVTGSIGTIPSGELRFPVNVNVSGGFHYMSYTPNATVNANALAAFSANSDSIYSNLFGKATLTGVALIPQYTATTFNQNNHEAFNYLSTTFLNMGVRYNF